MTVEIMVLALVLVVTATLIAMVMFVTRSGRAVDGDEKVEGLVTEMQSALAARDGALDARFAQIDTRLMTFQDSVTGRQAALDRQMSGIGNQMAGIATLFTNDRARGGWGEVSMLRIFELTGLQEGRDYTPHFHSGEGFPDAVVHLPGDRNLVIDSKFPVARYNEALETDDPAKRRALLVAQGKDIEQVGRSLVKRGYADLATAGHVVMYLPSQAVYEAAAEAHPEVIERLLQSRVIIAGPTGLYALLMNAAALITEHRSLRQSDQILTEAKELRRRMSTFMGHLQKMGASLASTVNAFNEAAGSWANRVSPQLTRINELNGQDPVDPLEPIDEIVREIELVRPLMSSHVHN